jgi:hypothetical protein
MKSKKLILFSILFLPTAIWVFLELSTINSRKLPHYGPKKANGKDTLFYSVDPTFKTIALNELKNISLDTLEYPLFAVSFVKQSYKTDNYRMAGLSEYIQYKKEKIKEIPFVIVTECDGLTPETCFKEFEILNSKLPTVHNFYCPTNKFDSLNRAYFFEKPIYIDYSFFVLVDTKRNIRGYYDGRYVAEIKRLIEEYQHLRLKHEKKNLINQNKIENK